MGMAHLGVIAHVRTKEDLAMSMTTLHGSMHFPRGRMMAFTTHVGERIARAWRNFTTRRHLAEMDDRMLQDLGISRAQAQFEANRPIWR
jgi:uncharacterized protein YjiS (DUF1127 family)